MSIRTIEAPGVQINEIDKSDYVRSLTGSKALVMGFADQGEDYEPKEINTTMGFVNYFGKPTNEAERYFYAACKEVINQNGKLYACKLPYDNGSAGKYVCKEYSIADNSKTISSDHSITADDVQLTESFQNYAKSEVLDRINLSNAEKTDLANTDYDLSDAIFDKIEELIGKHPEDFIAAFDLDNDDLDEFKRSIFNTASLDSRIEWAKEADLSCISEYYDKNAYNMMKDADSSIEKYLPITSDKNVSTLSFKTIDLYATGEAKPEQNSFVIVDKLRGAYDTASTKDSTGVLKECVGIVPVVTTAANALYVRDQIASGKNVSGKFNAVKTISSLEDKFELGNADCAEPLASDDASVETLSRKAASYFPPIGFNQDDNGEYHFETEHLRKIGVVVYRAYVDSAANNLISFEPIEAYAGELDPKAVNPSTGATTFIDTIINSNSETIYFFSNCGDNAALKDTDILVVEDQGAGSLGFPKAEMKKDISLSASINDGMQIVFQKNEDIHEKEIDLVVDAGLANIAQFIKDVYPSGKGVYDPTGENASLFKLKKQEDAKQWLATLQKFDTFCKQTRKDCMFVCDGLRPFCVQGSKKIVRPSKPTNTIDNAILPNVKYLTGMNTNYGAMYCNWFEQTDDFTGETFWCPPSIQAAGCYIFTDVNYNYWEAPAGLKRGVITAVDCAFSPSIKQAGSIYNKGINYAINYADNGIILEGQKTLQQKASAFDRVNVRRLFLRLERAVYNTARTFVYELNNAYNRQRFVDLLDPIFANVKAAGGCYDYKIICDESINTPEVIDNNELRIVIGVQPTKVAEFVLVQFYCMRTGGSWDELITEARV